MKLVTGRTAGLIDRYSINELKIPSLELMERASKAVAEAVRDYAFSNYSEEEALNLRIVSCSGVGNNGADGLCSLSILKSMGFNKLSGFYVGNIQKASEEFKYQRKRLSDDGIPIDEFYGRLTDCDIVIDAVFGIGLGREVKGAYLEAINEINRLKSELHAYIAAVDIPSGINADNGLNMCSPADAVCADITVSFGYAKTGHFMGKGPLYKGQLVIADIGYQETDDDYNGSIYETSDAGISDISACLCKRDRMANKGSYGKLLIIAGSKGMAGAAYLSGLAAFRSGIGMVKYLGTEDNRTILQTLLPEAMYESIDCLDDQLMQSLKWADCVTLGPGLSQSEEAVEIVRAFAEDKIKKLIADKLLLIDADALNIIAAHPELEEVYTEDTVITPHVGEFARLTGKTIDEIKKDPVNIASDYAAAKKVAVVLKDNVSVIAVPSFNNKPKVYINLAGSGALGKAGSGDVLTGIIQGVLAVINESGLGCIKMTSQNCNIGSKCHPERLMNAVYLFSKAGEAAGEALGEHCTLARDITDFISEAAKYAAGIKNTGDN